MWFGLILTTKTHTQMKRILLAVIFGVASLSSLNSKAQVSLSINIGSQPNWGPSGYDHVENYYLPDINAYYNVPSKQYTYQNNGSWITRNQLPDRYRDYNLYNGYKVVMNQSKPYLSNNSNVKNYSKYKNYNGKQTNLRDYRSRTTSVKSNKKTKNNNSKIARNDNRRGSSGRSGRN